jgi:hypothetical protein
MKKYPFRSLKTALIIKSDGAQIDTILLFGKGDLGRELRTPVRIVRASSDPHAISAATHNWLPEPDLATVQNRCPMNDTSCYLLKDAIFARIKKAYILKKLSSYSFT